MEARIKQPLADAMDRASGDCRRGNRDSCDAADDLREFGNKLAGLYERCRRGEERHCRDYQAELQIFGEQIGQSDLGRPERSTGLPRGPQPRREGNQSNDDSRSRRTEQGAGSSVAPQLRERPQQSSLEGPYWHAPANGVPNLWLFRKDGTGLRTGYVTGKLEFGTQYPFAWTLDGSILRVQFGSGYTDTFQITGYDERRDVLALTGSGRSQAYGPGPWFGCASGQIPPVIARSLCRR